MHKTFALTIAADSYPSLRNCTQVLAMTSLVMSGFTLETSIRLLSMSLYCSFCSPLRFTISEVSLVRYWEQD